MRHLFLVPILLVWSTVAQSSIDLSDQPGALSEGLYRNVHLPHGIPLGGIGCGSLELGTDGWFDRLRINNNWGEYLPRPASSFFAVWIRDGERKFFKVLRRPDPAFDSVDRITYRGIFPRATLTFSDDDIPINIDLDAWTPLIAWNLEDSALPGALFSFQCKNTAQRPLEMAFAFAWENLVGAGVDPETGTPWVDRIGNYQELRHSRRASGLLFGATRNLEANDPRRSAIGTHALALERQDTHTVTFLPSWDARSSETFADLFSDDGLLFDEEKAGPRPIGSETVHPAGAVADRFSLQPGESCQVTFALAWHCPVVLGPDGTEGDHIYAASFDDAWEVATYLLKNRDRLWSETEKWRDALLSSSLPPWLKIRLLNDLTPLFSRSILIGGRFMLLEDPSKGTLQSTFAAFLTDSFLLSFFPELSASGLRLAAEGQREDGEIPSAPGSLPEIFGGGRPGVGRPQDPLSACAFALRLRQYDQFIGDDALRTELYPTLKRAMAWLATQDTDQDGIPEGGDPTQDPEGKRNLSVTANLCLAARRAGADLASALGDLETVSELHKSANRARESTLAELWNGRYFKAFFDPSSPALPQASSLRPDQLLGEWFAHVLGWDSLLPPDLVRTALDSLLECHRPLSEDTRRVGQGPPTGTFDDAVNGGPRPTLHPNTRVLSAVNGGPRPTLHPDTRVLSVLASLAAYEGHAAEGLSLVYDLHRRATTDGLGLALPAFIGSDTGSLDAMAGPASWSFLVASQGLVFDARLGRLALSPHIPKAWEGVHIPVFTSKFRGWMDYAAPTSEASRRISFHLEQTVDGRRLVLSQIATDVPPAFRDLKPVLFLEGFPGGGGPSRRSLDLLTLVLDEPLTLGPGEGFTLVLATEATGRIDVNLGDRSVVPRGPACSIDILPDLPLTFTITNRLPRPQVLNLWFTNLTEESYRVAVDGREVAPLETEGSVITLPLPGSPFSETQEQRAQWVRRQLNRIVQLVAEYPAESAALSEVWKLPKAVEQFFLADVGGRMVTVDVYKSDAKPPKRKPTKRLSPRDAKQIITDLEEAIVRFRSNISEVVVDPSLAARLLGLALPIELRLQVSGDPGERSSFELVATITNPDKLPFRGRIVIITPEEEWQVTAENPTSFDVGPSPLDMVTRRFQVRMPGPAFVRRVEVAVRFLGDLSQQPFVLEDAVAVGHGYVSDWMILGPYPNQEDRGLSEVLFPEQEVDLEGRYEGLNGEIGWRPHHSATGYVDLARVFEVGGPALAFAHVYLYSPHNRLVLLHLGATQGVRAVLNQQQELTRNDHQPARPNQYLIRANLRRGWNSLVLKVSRLRGDWGFYLEITDLEGRPVPDLKITLRK